mgnify:FL=1
MTTTEIEMRDEKEHPINQKIQSISFQESGCAEYYSVGKGGVTRIEAAIKSGMYANIPYVRVWGDDVCIAEFCQHHLLGVFFSSEPESDQL